MGVDEGDVSINVDVILENCPITFVIRYLLVYSTLQYSTVVIILNDSKCHRNNATIHKNVI